MMLLPDMTPYCPRLSPFVASMVISCLLLTSDDVECNPCSITNSSHVLFGCLNVHSAVHREVLMHNIIRDNIWMSLLSRRRGFLQT